MKPSPASPVVLSTDQLAELRQLTSEVERAILPVVRERDEHAAQQSQQALRQSINGHL